MNRRMFFGGGLASLGFAALPGGIFAAPAGFRPPKKPNLVFGVLSDTHLMVEWDGKSLYRTMTLDYIHNAFRLFKRRGIDAFVHLGDASHRGCVREWEFHKEVFEKVFGKAGGPEKIVVVGNHELFGGAGHCRGVYRDQKAWEENAICADVKRHYERIWGAPYSEFFHREVGGCHFFGRHWVSEEEEYKGSRELPFADYIRSHAEPCSLQGTRPFFILSHRRHHFRFCSALRGFPNAVAFMGHWHQSNADWKSIYCDRDTFGGFFPHMEVGACRFDGGNGLYPPGEIHLPEDPSSFKGGKLRSRQAMVVNVHDDMVVFERHEVGEGGKLGPDWVLPLGQHKPHPFLTAELKKVDGRPEFAPRAKLAVALGSVERDAKKEPALRISIPVADGNPGVRPYAYNVVVVGDDPKARFFKSEYFSGVNSGAGHEPDHGATHVTIPIAELPAGRKLTVAVRPVSSLGTTGRAIGTTWKT
ncbi:MAG: metallophosphoesterase [Kiritimatiellae bacterium]|nr:metallophosphoesterase [Kiritimatiellia bacterium]